MPGYHSYQVEPTLSFYHSILCIPDCSNKSIYLCYESWR